MQCQEAMAALESCQHEGTKKTFLRHGAKEPLYGVRIADQTKLAKQIKVDHALADALMTTGNTDARVLAMLIADPKALTFAQADRWLHTMRWHMEMHYLGQVVGRSAVWQQCMQAWMDSDDELIASCGYGLLCQRLKEDAASIADGDAKKILATIERQIHRAQNRVRLNMNSALIAIGTYKVSLREAAIAAAGRIGPVQVDHGDTDCKTPDAASYILKAGAHADRMAQGRAAKKGKGQPGPADATGPTGRAAPAQRATKPRSTARPAAKAGGKKAAKS